MKNLDRIITLLEKNYLSETDLNLLNTLMDEDPEAKEFFKTYIKLENAFKSLPHLNTDELADYMLIKNELEPLNPEVVKKIPLFEQHIKRCEKCSSQLQIMKNEMGEITSFVNGNLNKQIDETQKHSVQSVLFAQRSNFIRSTFIGASVLAIFVFALVLVSNVTTSKLYNLAAAEEAFELSISRGRTTNDFEMSIKAIEEKDYSSAVKYLQNDIKLNPNDETIFYSYFILGLTYLETAEKNILGLFPSFDKTSAALALENFKKSIEHNTSGKFQNVNLDSYFFAAKACLMLEDKKSAEEYLKIVVNEKGSKLNQAAAILKELK